MVEKFLGTELVCLKDWENRNVLLKKYSYSWEPNEWKPMWVKIVDRDGELKIILFKSEFSELMKGLKKDKLPRQLLFLRIIKNRIKFKLKELFFPEPSKDSLKKEIIKNLAMGWLFKDRDAIVASQCYRNVLRAGAHWYTNVAYSDELHPYLNILEVFGTPALWFEKDGKEGILDEFKGLTTPKQKMKKWKEIEKRYFEQIVEVRL